MAAERPPSSGFSPRSWCPAEAIARIQGFDAAREPNKVRQQTGIVFQARSLDIKLTVAENLKHQGHLYGLSGARLKARSDEVLAGLD